MVPPIPRARFEALVADALDAIPPELGEAMENVAVVVDDWPSREQAREYDGMLLGLYEGVDLTRRSPLSYASVVPDRITIFREPICRVAVDVEDVERVIRRTVVHEVAHHFGISDERLDELGWA